MEDVEEFESPSEYLMEETISSLDQSTTTTFKEEMTTTSKTHPAEETEAPTTTQRDVPTTMAVEIADEPTAISETSAETLSTRPSITLTIQAEEEEPGEEEKANNPSASDIEEEEEEEDSNLIPIEVPLQVQLIIAPEADRNAAGPSGALPPSPVVLQTGRSAAYNDRRHPYVSSYEAESPPVCTSKATVVAISIVAVLLHVLLLAAFYAFYRTRRARWAKLVGHNGRPGSPSGGLRHSGSISEVVDPYRTLLRVPNYNLKQILFLSDFQECLRSEKWTRKSIESLPPERDEFQSSWTSRSLRLRKLKILFSFFF